MKKLIIACGISASLISPFAIADDNYQTGTETPVANSVTGFGVGAVIGAVAGGPPGALIGAFAGLLVADSDHSGKQLKLSEAEISKMNLQIDSLAEENQQMRDEAVKLASINNDHALAAIGQKRTSETLMAISKGFTFAVQFRSNSIAIEKHYKEQLQNLAKSLMDINGLSVDLTGYADPRGDNIYNLELSKRRVDVVKDILINAGLSEDRIGVSSVGEGEPIYSIDDSTYYPFERRVQITFSFGDASSGLAQAE